MSSGEGYLLIGPVSRDHIVRGDSHEVKAGGAVYYYSRLLSHLGVRHTALVTISEDDSELLEEFPDKTRIVPVYHDRTVEFENIYSNGDTAGRTQRSNFAENPIEVEDLEGLASLDWTAVLAGPLLPSDIPLRTLEFLGERHRLYTGLQGYLRHPQGRSVILKPAGHIWRVMEAGDGVFLDVNELGTISDNPLRALRMLAEHTPEAVVTCGRRGSVICHGDSRTRIRAVRAVRELDPTGLGDTYMAAYVHARRMVGPEAAGRFASLMATRKLEGEI